MNKMLRNILFLLVAAGASFAALPLSVGEMSPAIEMTVADIHVRGHQLDIVISDDAQHQIVIYALTGQVVKSLTVQEGTTTLDLSPGYYIVKIDHTSRRIVIR